MNQEDQLEDEDTTLAGVCQYLSKFYADESNALKIGSVFPGYHDHYAESEGKASFGRLPEYSGRTFEASVAQAFRHQPAFVQVATWNDFQEGTVLEPATGREHTPFYF